MQLPSSEQGRVNDFEGLPKCIKNTKQIYSKRIWVIDNSDSMLKCDSRRVIRTTNSDCQEKYEMISCTRWEELLDCLQFQIWMSSSFQQSASFRLLNHPGAFFGPQEFDVSAGYENHENQRQVGQKVEIDLHVMDDGQKAWQIMQAVRPKGNRPLTKQILNIYEEIKEMVNQLQSEEKKVGIMIATDGLPTNEIGNGGRCQQREFAEALRRFEGLPVTISIRLCTNEEHVISYYKELEFVLDLSIEVIDIYEDEAQKVFKVNPWFNYSLDVHRMREAGLHCPAIKSLHEGKLSKVHIGDICSFLLGDSIKQSAPDLSSNWNGFLTYLKHLEWGEHWNPIKKKMSPHIDVSILQKLRSGNRRSQNVNTILRTTLMDARVSIGNGFDHFHFKGLSINSSIEKTSSFGTRKNSLTKRSLKGPLMTQFRSSHKNEGNPDKIESTTIENSWLPRRLPINSFKALRHSSY